jgi:hypothetical protein
MLNPYVLLQLALQPTNERILFRLTEFDFGVRLAGVPIGQ